MSTKKQMLRRLTVSAVMIALSTVLSMVKVLPMPLGGSITLLSMVPICSLGLFYGFSASLLPCFVYGVIQVFLGNVFSWGLSWQVLVACILMDYVVPYTCMSLSGLFYRKGLVAQMSGVALALVARFVCHFVSGVVLWTNFERFNNPYLYSLAYNGAYMLPELIFTVVAFGLLLGTGAFARVKALATK